MKRLRRKADAMNLDSSVALDANNVMNQLQSYNPKLNNDNLIADIGAKAIIGFVDDSGQYVFQLESLANAIIETIPEYVFADYKGSSLPLAGSVSRLREAAKSIYKIKEFFL